MDMKAMGSHIRHSAAIAKSVMSQSAIGDQITQYGHLPCWKGRLAPHWSICPATESHGGNVVVSSNKGKRRRGSCGSVGGEQTAGDSERRASVIEVKCTYVKSCQNRPMLQGF